jgi:hypothetical protein
LTFENDRIEITRDGMNDKQLKPKKELLIMGTLYILGHNNLFMLLPTNTKTRDTTHQQFFHIFWIICAA